MEITLDMLCPEKMAVVTSIEAEKSLHRRLKAYGLVPGTIVRCRYKTPCGKVTALELRGSVIALRTVDLKDIRGCGL